MTKDENNKKNIENKTDPSDLRKVGKVKDAHGIRGEIYLLVFSKDPSWAEDLSEFELRSADESKRQRLTIEKIRLHKDGLVVKAKEILDRNQAEALKGWMLYVDEELFTTSDEDEDFYLTEIEGFELIDEALGSLGRIESFGTNGAQDLLNITYKGLEVSVPLVEDWIDEIDFEDEKIYLMLPDGLLESQLPGGATEEKDDDKE